MWKRHFQSKSFWLIAATVGLVAVLCGWWARALSQPSLRLEIGAFEGGLLAEGWSRSERAEIDPPGAADGVTSFYYRALLPTARFALPVRANGDALRVVLRAKVPVRSNINLFVNGAPAGEVLIKPGRWDFHNIDVPASTLRGDALDLAFVLHPMPLVRGAHADNPRLLLDRIDLLSARGYSLSNGAALMIIAIPLLIFVAAVAIGCSPAMAGLGAGLAALLLVPLVHAAPFACLTAIPRLLPMALIATLIVWWLLRRYARQAPATMLAAVTFVGALAHGAIVFFPDHQPPDIYIHVRRAIDFGSVPLSYDALMRYSSQLPTATQDMGPATFALGEKTLIPYSPVPYVFYFAAHALGLDLYWFLTVFNACLAMAVAPAVFLAANRLWNRPAAWMATTLYILDLAVWHRLARSHAPAVFGGALLTLAMLFLCAQIERLDGPRRRYAAAGLLAVAALGYSSAIVLLGIFGLILLALLALDARALTPAMKRGAAIALVLGGLIAGALFYFHYVPGLLAGARGVEAEPDLFPGKTFFIFHNESRQSLRIWILGYGIGLAAGLLALPWALARGRRSARPVLLAWASTWITIMILKEPIFYPKLLRWAKEDQFLSPLLCLLIAGAIWTLPRAWLRWALTLLTLGTAVWLAMRDYWHHMVSLRL
jgi:hypothetical protein